jgi:hypothetical protein
VVSVGLFAGADSWSHIYHLARAHHQDVLSAALVPLAGDGLVLAASAAMLAAARNGKVVPLRARLMMAAGIGATIAANVAYGLAGGLTDALLSVWAVAAYVGCTELLVWLRQNLGVQVQPKVQRTVPRSVPVPGTGDELSDRPRRQPVHDLLKRAEEVFPGGLAPNGKLASVRDIKDAVSVGQPRAQQIQAHFRRLQAA